MQGCRHIQQAPLVRPLLYFTGLTSSCGTICSSRLFFIASHIGGDDEKYRSCSFGNGYGRVRNFLVCSKHRSTGQHDGETRCGSALQRLRHRAGWQGIDGLDRWSARPELTNDRSGYRFAGCRSSEGSTSDGDRRRSERTAEAVFSASNARVAAPQRASSSGNRETVVTP